MSSTLPELDPSLDATPESPRRSWIPIRSLGSRHRGRVVRHLFALDTRSRYLRFGYAATDEQIERYADGLDFERDELFGIFNRRLELIGQAHLAYRPAASYGLTTSPAATVAEFGVSVLPQARRRGLGSRLFEHAVLHARNRQVRTLFIHALSENTAMLRIARHAGATVERLGSESEAWLALPEDTFASHIDAALGERAAELDYQWKLKAHQPSDHPSERSMAREDSR